MIECVIRSNNSVTKFAARNWYDFIRKVDQLIQSETVTFPLGEDDDMEMVEKKIKEVDKFN